MCLIESNTDRTVNRPALTMRVDEQENETAMYNIEDGTEPIAIYMFM